MRQTIFTSFAAAAGALMLVACETYPAAGPAGGCPITGSDSWNAWVNAMPGPGARPTLIVTGRVTTPTGGYRPALQMEQVAESYPVQVFVRLHPNPPAGPATQALVTHDVRGDWSMSTQVGSVTVRCGNAVIAHISPVGTAH